MSGLLTICSRSDDLNQHNNGESVYTSRKIPWTLVYIEEMSSKKDVIILERNLKKTTLERIEALLTAPKNIVHQIYNP